jgi:hypothetical protein
MKHGIKQRTVLLGLRLVIPLEVGEDEGEVGLELSHQWTCAGRRIEEKALVPHGHTLSPEHSRGLGGPPKKHGFLVVARLFHP